MSAEGVDFRVPSDALVLLVGAAGSGKSTFAARWFPSTAVLSSDAFRDLVSGDPANQRATRAAFRLLHAAAAERVARGLFTVVDATNVLHAARVPLLELARRDHRPAWAIAFGLSLEECLAWNASRGERAVPERVVRRQHGLLSRAMPHLEAEGWQVIRLAGPGAVIATTLAIEPAGAGG